MAKNSIIILCKNIKLDKNYQNVLSYTESQMYTLCYQNRITMGTNFSFIREEENAINVQFTYEECLKSNYIAFQNPRYSNKWFFAFVDSVTYISDKTTKINFTIDIYATWFDYWSPKSCFVVREHVNDDTVGANLIPEGLETGEYINENTSNLYSANNTYICVGLSEVIDEIPLNVINSRYGGIYSGIKYILCDSAQAASNLIKIYDNEDKADAINCIFLIPQNLVGTVTFTTVTVGNTTTSIAVVPYTDSATLLDTSSNITPPSAFDNYIPENKKLLTFPYCYFYVSNNIGQDVVFHYEDFINNTAVFKTYGSVTPGCSIKCVPINYKKLADGTSSTYSFNSGVVGAKLPMCSWVTDPYINWLTQNGVNIAGVTLNQQEASNIVGIGSMLLGAGLMATGVGTMAGAGLMIGGATAMYNSMQSNYQKDLTPLQARGSTSSGDIQYSTGMCVIQLFRVSIRKEFAKCIDDFFTRYGYKINRLKLPNQTGRTYFNYVEIGKGEIIGYPNNKGCPSEAMEEINNIYRNGVTIWHSHDRIGNYTQNTIVQNN